MPGNPQEQDISIGSNSQEIKPIDKKGWMAAAFVVVAILLLGILSYIMLSSSGFLGEPGAYITITEPVQGAVLDITLPITVKGQGGGLFEGNVIVLALNNTRDVLAQQPTTIDSPEAGIGGEVSWSVELVIDSLPGTQGQVVAYSSSPADDNTIASDSVSVTFGGALIEKETIDLEEHFWVLVSLNGEPLIDNTHISLQFEKFTAKGTAGCNHYSSSYERRGFHLNIGLVTSTAKSCESPIGVMLQEEDYFAALEQAAAFNVTNQHLKVFKNSNDLLLIYNAVVMGSIVVPEGIELPPDAIVHISLNDVSLADVEAEPVAEQVISSASGFPIPFMVIYDPQVIKENNNYAIGVRIEDRSGNLLFINTTAYPVITGENPSVLDVMVEEIQ